MVNILLEGYDIAASYLKDELSEYIKPEHSVAVEALSFRDNRVKSVEDWNKLYSKENGMYYGGIVGGFTAYGVAEENISFINYFTDTHEAAARKIANADIVYFLGGLPNRMMDRIIEMELYDVLMNHKGIVMGYSAGAVIQLAEYHLSRMMITPNLVIMRVFRISRISILRFIMKTPTFRTKRLRGCCLKGAKRYMRSLAARGQ